MYEHTELAVKIGDQFIMIQESEEGMDYSIFNENYYLVDGGVLDVDDTLGNPIISALVEILIMHDIPKLEIQKVSFNELFEKTAERELEEIESKTSLLDKVDKISNLIKPKTVDNNKTIER
ncbi:hypothetical protein HB949_01455 [Listeria welshimeri]|nr:hypothetical protein [Listeria welshimeri]